MCVRESTCEHVCVCVLLCVSMYIYESVRACNCVCTCVYMCEHCVCEEGSKSVGGWCKQCPRPSGHHWQHNTDMTQDACLLGPALGAPPKPSHMAFLTLAFLLLA